MMDEWTNEWINTLVETEPLPRPPWSCFPDQCGSSDGGKLRLLLRPV